VIPPHGPNFLGILDREVFAVSIPLPVLHRPLLGPLLSLLEFDVAQALGHDAAAIALMNHL